MPQNTTSLEELLVELNKDPEFREARKQQRSYFELLDAIMHRRKRLGLTQQQLADRVGDHQSAISRLESGAHAISLEKFLDILQALEAKIEIVPREDGSERQIIKLFGGASYGSASKENVGYSDQATHAYKTAGELSFVEGED